MFPFAMFSILSNEPALRELLLLSGRTIHAALVSNDEYKSSGLKIVAPVKRNPWCNLTQSSAAAQHQRPTNTLIHPQSPYQDNIAVCSSEMLFLNWFSLSHLSFRLEAGAQGVLSSLKYYLAGERGARDRIYLNRLLFNDLRA